VKDDISPGHAFRAAFLERYESDEPADLLVLDMAAETLDECHRLRDELEAAGFLVAGSKGQPVANPLLKELRAHRAAFVALARQVEPEDDKPLTRTAAAALARKRWRG
jgi:hypothetical protein